MTSSHQSDLLNPTFVLDLGLRDMSVRLDCCAGLEKIVLFSFAATGAAHLRFDCVKIELHLLV